MITIRQRAKNKEDSNWSNRQLLVRFDNESSTVTFSAEDEECAGATNITNHTIVRSWIQNGTKTDSGILIETNYIDLELNADNQEELAYLHRVSDELTGIGNVANPSYHHTPSKSISQQTEGALMENGNDTSINRATGSGPFGLSMGIRKEDIVGNLEEVAPFLYLTTDVPKKHSRFESYLLQISPVHGLSMVKGIGFKISTNPYGFEIKTSFEEMKEKLVKIYGKSETSDFLMNGSIWNESRDWLQGLVNGERYLFAKWDQSTTRNSLPNDLETVYVGASATDTYSGCINVEYYFKNNQQSKQELELMEDDAL